MRDTHTLPLSLIPYTLIYRYSSVPKPLRRRSPLPRSSWPREPRRPAYSVRTGTRVGAQEPERRRRRRRRPLWLSGRQCNLVLLKPAALSPPRLWFSRPARCTGSVCRCRPPRVTQLEAPAATSRRPHRRVRCDFESLPSLCLGDLI